MESIGLMGKRVMRTCDHQILMDGMVAEVQAKSTLFLFPYPSNPVMIPMDKVAVPSKEVENPRCK